MKYIKTVGELRELLNNFEDDWNIEFLIQRECDNKIFPYYTEKLKIENEIIDVCYSDKIITAICEEEGGLIT